MAIDFEAQGLALAARAQGLVHTTMLAGRLTGNFAPDLLASWNRAKARVHAGLGDAVVAMIGDSTTNGHGAGDSPTGNFTNAARRAAPARVAARLTAMGLPAAAEPVFGSHLMDGQNGPITILPLYDPHLKIASSGRSDWYATSLLSLGGCYFQNDTGSGSLALTPVQPFDAVEIVALHHGNGGTLRVALGEVTIGAIDTHSETTRIVRTTVPTGGAPATGGTIALTRADRGVAVIGLIPRNTQGSRVQVVNAGWQGARTGDWASHGDSAAYRAGLSVDGSWRPLAALQRLAPDVTVINFGLNDVAVGTPVAVSRANLKTIVTGLRATSGAVILVVPPPQNPTKRDTIGLTGAYNAMVRALAAELGCGLIDLHARYGSHAAGSALGYYTDGVHMTALGYADVADVVARALFDS